MPTTDPRSRAVQDPHVQLRAVLRRCFPRASRIIAIPRQPEAMFAVSWPLGNDPARPGKRSRVIRLTVANEVLDHYLGASQTERRMTDQQISKAIRSALAAFDANHSHSAYDEPSIVDWNVGV